MTISSATKTTLNDLAASSAFAIADDSKVREVVHEDETDASINTTVWVAKTAEDVEKLRASWSDWCDDPSVDLDVFLTQLRYDRGNPRPYIITLYRDGRPDCLLAGRLMLDHMHFSFGGVRLLLPKARLIRIESGGFLGNQSEENSRVIVRELLRTLQSKEADSVEFSSIRTDSPLYRCATKLPGMFCRNHFPPRMSHCSLLLPGSFKEFLGGLSRKKRHNLVACLKGFEKAFPGQINVRRLSQETDLEAFLHDCDLIASKTYQRRLNTGFVNDQPTREIMKIRHASGTLWGYVLEIAGQPSAFILGARQRGTAYPLCMAYDPQYSRFSPGSFLLIQFIQDAWSRHGGCRRIDFGHGNHRYKREISNEQWSEAAVTLFAPTPKWIGINLLRTSLALTRQAAITILGNPRCRDASVRIWRQFVIKKRSWAGLNRLRSHRKPVS